MSGALPGEVVLQSALAELAEGRDLPRESAQGALGAIMAGEATPAQIGALLMALRLKGETTEELTGAALAMRAVATRVETQRRPLLDTCGTGGDQRATYNISTAVALLAAGAGVAVAKHGNRSVSSRSGSADVLEASGVKIDLTAAQMGRCLDEVGFAFLFAPVLHGAMKHAIGPRRELKLRTIFNLLGPLTNPAGADRQLLGVFSEAKAEQLAGVLAALGSEAAWVVHARDGHDELSIAADTCVFEVKRGAEPRMQLLSPPPGHGGSEVEAGLAGGGPAENAAWLDRLLRGEEQGPSRAMVRWNAAAALVVAGKVDTLDAGVALAEETLASQRGHRVLTQLRELTWKL